ncbi:Nif3-like dinuclear metal center hexameric protein [Chengkuizengella axinellae]|uniref:GTP cyclohydrolase 1 type 2 homolog n=1 Tax=Chengkuizengella axinellae TaxID=3064388 RepID=A0ABT9IUS7_9BACL|nr:Nif3-like dinuclear metal center hexameric protein [Chengkuizengella sp. 2205SS18-9]MDP5273109.1 Nif3-like dinuclear metal center hexameric protein [Chengkuizengella sp. 2205SS18-9]
MSANGQTIIQLLEQWTPKYYAVPDDKIGLQLGTLNKKIDNVMVTLDVTEQVVDEAIENDVGLIIAHHPIIFRPLKHIRTDFSAGRIYEKCIKHDIAVYIAHTNLDVAEGGINDMMANALGLKDLSPLEEVHTEKLNKLVVFVPEEAHNNVLKSIFAAGAGWIGDYSHCSFNIKGEGTFLPHVDTDPYIGEQGKLTKVNEIRIETIVPQSIQRKVIQAMLKAHPYEEVAYDLYPMDLKGKSFGLGRVGRLPRIKTLEELSELVKLNYDVTMVKTVGILNKPIHKVAVLGGSGSRYVQQAKYAGADVLITGDIDFHTAQDALADGMSIIDPGHHAEKIMIKHVAGYLQKEFDSKNIGTNVLESNINTDPFTFL